MNQVLDLCLDIVELEWFFFKEMLKLVDEDKAFLFFDFF
jgi:hypothetical protein